MKMSRIHSSFPAVMSHFFAISAKAPENCSSDSLSRCFRFSSLCRSNVTFVFLTKAIARESQYSLKEICKIFSLINFCAKNLFHSFPNARYRTDRNFLSGSSSRISLNFLVSDLLEADSSSSYLSFLFLDVSLHSHLSLVICFTVHRIFQIWRLRVMSLRRI